jgi:hypothetical protein
MKNDERMVDLVLVDEKVGVVVEVLGRKPYEDIREIALNELDAHTEAYFQDGSEVYKLDWTMDADVHVLPTSKWNIDLIARINAAVNGK